MDYKQEREMYVEMLVELIKQRRMIMEETVLVRKRIEELDRSIERQTEYMSATEYVNIRNNIKRELEEDLRSQLEKEIRSEPKPEVIPKEIVSEAKFQDNKSGIKKDISVRTVASIIARYLKENGEKSNEEIQEFVEEDRNHTWKRLSFYIMISKAKKFEPGIVTTKRGYCDYVEGETEND